MAIKVICDYKVGDKVRFRLTGVEVVSHFLPRGLVGTVKEAAMTRFGLSVREELAVEFVIEGQNTLFRGLDGGQMEKTA